MKMNRFFATQIVEWEVTVQNDKVDLFRKALKEFGINLFEVEHYKNNTTRVVYHCVCNSLMKIGIEFGALLAEQDHKTQKKV